MSRWVLVLAVVIAMLGCGTRRMVVQPEELSKLNDPHWTIKSEPRR